MFTQSFRRASNRADWRWSATLTDATTGAAIDLTGASLAIALAEPGSTQRSPLVSGSTTDGRVTITGAAAGQFSVVLPRSAMVDLDAQHYEVGLTVVLASGAVHQLVIATLPIADGVVAA